VSSEELKLGTIPVVSPQYANRDLRILLWGKSGSGKTTLAATAPGRKLFLNFDPQGYLSVANRDDVLVADLSGERAALMDRLKEDNFMGVESVIDKSGCDTVVVDSLTSVSGLALENAVGSGKYKGASIETPTLGGYGHRNAQTLAFTKSILRSVAKKGKHLVLITHEDSPDRDPSTGAILSITMMLGGALPEVVGLRLSEIWNVTDIGTARRIAIRPCRSRVPMKTRMFRTDGQPEFNWKYDPITNEGEGISTWYQQWIDTNQRVPVPK